MSQWGTRLALVQQPGLCVFVASTEFQSQWDKQIYDPGNLYGKIHYHRNEISNVNLCVLNTIFYNFVTWYLTKCHLSSGYHISFGLRGPRFKSWPGYMLPRGFPQSINAVITSEKSTTMSSISCPNHCLICPVIQCHVICANHSIKK